ncbi:MAG: CRTAC1 family protein [Acidobacteriota bacterium]
MTFAPFLALSLVLGPPSPGTSAASPLPPAEPLLADVTTSSGVRFRHHAHRSPEKLLPETMGSGLALLDIDVDGDLDLYFVQGAPAAPAPPETADVATPPTSIAPDELWLNGGTWRFTSATNGPALPTGLGMGACHGDVDGDGDPDLVVAQVGPDLLLLTEKGRPSTGRALPGSDGFASSCSFLDADGDGDLDLAVVDYVDWSEDQQRPFCGDVGTGERAYCTPDAHRPVSDRLYRGDGDGGFVEVSTEAGLDARRGYGLGLLASDLDRDGDLELVVANDGSANHAWENDGSGRFRERGLAWGLALNEDGRAEAGMGVDSGDVDGNGRPDVVMTHLDLQSNTLWSQDTPGRFRDHSARAGLITVSAGLVGFGVELTDFDLDGRLDLAIANGHVIDNITSFRSDLTHAQADQLLLGDGQGGFRLVPPLAGGFGAKTDVSRGLASGDLDGDGDPDLVVTLNDGPARLYRNDATGRRPALTLALTATRTQAGAQGAWVSLLEAEDGVVLEREVRAARSYQSQGSSLLHLPRPTRPAVVRVAWPSGHREHFAGLAGPGPHRLVEGKGSPVSETSGEPGPRALAGLPPGGIKGSEAPPPPP